MKDNANEDETEPEALKGKIFEETGLRSVKILSKFHEYEFVFRNTKHKVYSYLAKTNSRELIKLQKSGVADCIWMTKDETLQMLCWSNEKRLLTN